MTASAVLRPVVAPLVGRRRAASTAAFAARASPARRRAQYHLRSPLSSSSSSLFAPPTTFVAPPGAACRFKSDSTGAATALGMSIEDTPLGSTKAGAALLDGLDVHIVPAAEDGHPLAVYGIDSMDVEPPAEVDDDEEGRHHARHPVLMLHGRTWSSVPVYHLLGGPQNAAEAIEGRESRSLMESLLHSGLQPYAMDFRGFGGTPPDSTKCVEPNICVRDVETVLRWIAERHGLVDGKTGEEISPRHCEIPALLGWSQGALVAQLAAQRSPRLLSKLVLYGSIYDPNVRYPREPLYLSNASSSAGEESEDVMNQYDAAIEDFTVEGTIPPEPARLFAEAALVTDPIKARWKHLHQFNNCDPARVNVPTLVIAGDQDPYAPLRVQSDLFTNLGRGADRTWSIMSDADHAVHLLDGRARFVKIVKNFVENGRRGSESGEDGMMLF